MYSAVEDDKSRKKGLFSEKEEEITYAEEDKTNTILHYSIVSFSEKFRREII